LGRKRKRVIRGPRKSLPRVYACPRCGEQSVMVVISRENRIASVTCGNIKCGLSANVPVSSVDQVVDAYCRFADMYHSGKLP